MTSLRLSMALASLLTSAAQSGLPGPRRVIAFDDQKPGEQPRGFTCALTGQGRPGVWRVVEDAAAATGPNVLAQSDQDATSYRFPQCVLDAISGTDVDVSVRFRPISGARDQAAGIVWRYRDPNNYYVVRANALEDNVVLYKVAGGKRTDLDPKGSARLAPGRRPTP